MGINFTKYQGTGNDFIIIDNRNNSIKDIDVKTLCDRKFGIGADGLMLLELETGYDFKMVYYNSDGAISTMCGNGGRCLAHFAQQMGVFHANCKFIAIDGEHLAEVNGSIVSLKMNDITAIKEIGEDMELNTGSPHYIRFTDKLPIGNIVEAAREIRNSNTYIEQGINVNFVCPDGNTILLRTYERGVEDETLSCGTGVTAATLATHKKQGALDGTFHYFIESMGGKLEVKFQYNNGNYTDVWLIGPATEVFKGII